MSTPGGHPPPNSLLEARDLRRHFGPVRAVDGISFSVAPGEILTVLGPNGAGKSTLLGILAGVLRPQEGEVLFRGHPVRGAETAWRRELGLLSHRTGLYGALTARENLRFFGRLFRVDGLDDRLTTRLREVGLEEAADRPVHTFSRGMRQRLALARTLLGDPALVLLDEPFTGLDLHASSLLRGVLEGLRDGTRTVVLVTHNLAEGLALADRVAIQFAGRFTFLGARAEIPAGAEETFYRARIKGAAGGGRP